MATSPPAFILVCDAPKKHFMLSYEGGREEALDHASRMTSQETKLIVRNMEGATLLSVTIQPA